MPTRGRRSSSNNRPRSSHVFQRFRNCTTESRPTLLSRLLFPPPDPSRRQAERERRKSERVVSSPRPTAPAPAFIGTSATAQVRQSLLPPIPIFSPPVCSALLLPSVIPFFFFFPNAWKFWSPPFFCFYFYFHRSEIARDLLKLEQWNRKACLDPISVQYRIFNNSKVRKFFTSNYTNCFCISKITFPRVNVKERFYPRVPFYSLLFQMRHPLGRRSH